MKRVKGEGEGPHTLAIDVGGTGVKASLLDAKGRMVAERLRVATPYPCLPNVLLRVIVELARRLPPFDRISLGFPGVVRDGRIVTAPHFGTAIWRGHDLTAALTRRLGKPARILNDAEVQGLGIVAGHGLELVLTLGTGVGSAIFSHGHLAPHLELAQHPLHKSKTYNDYLGDAARHAVGTKRWNRRVLKMIGMRRGAAQLRPALSRRRQFGASCHRAARQCANRVQRHRPHRRHPPVGRCGLGRSAGQRRHTDARPARGAGMSGIALVISDIDGTLVTSDKHLTERTRAAVAALRRRGIGFTIVSSRPPFGLRMLIEPLGLSLPVAAFNGGVIADPDLAPIEERVIGAEAARAAIALFDAGGVDTWLFTTRSWVARDPAGVYVERERRTVLTEPEITASFEPYLDQAAKIVGVSDNFDRLAALEGKARGLLSDRATVARSQLYYLDVTPQGTNKGTAVAALCRRLGVPPARLVTIGDMENDVPMFRIAGFSIAMGNASDAVKRQANAATLSNDEDGFADAVERLILPRAASRMNLPAGNAAPGGPGITARWTSSAKSGVGTAPTSASRVWYTLSHGILDEIYYPRVDYACTRDFGLIVTDAAAYFSEEKRDTQSTIRRVTDDVPAFMLRNEARDGRYRIEKTVLADPSRDVVLQRIRFVPLAGTIDDYRLCALLAPHLVNRGANNTAWVESYKGREMLFASGSGSALALACSAPWRARSVGFVGVSDGWQDLMQHFALTWRYAVAEDGNVALTGEIDLAACGGEFVLALGFGRRAEEAAHRVIASLNDGVDAALAAFIAGWQQWQATLLPLDQPDRRGQHLPHQHRRAADARGELVPGRHHRQPVDSLGLQQGRRGSGRLSSRLAARPRRERGRAPCRRRGRGCAARAALARGDPGGGRPLAAELLARWRALLDRRADG